MSEMMKHWTTGISMVSSSADVDHSLLHLCKKTVKAFHFLPMK